MLQRLSDFGYGVALCACFLGYWQDRHGSLDAYVAYLRDGHWTQDPAIDWVVSGLMVLVMMFVVPMLPTWRQLRSYVR